MPLSSELKYFLHLIAFICWISLVEIFYGVLSFDFFRKSGNEFEDFVEEFNPIERFFLFFFNSKNRKNRNYFKNNYFLVTMVFYLI